MDICLKLKRATKENFKDFGMLITPENPEFECAEFDWHENLAKVNLGIAEIGMVIAKNTGHYIQKTLERHTATKEILVPIKDDIILVLGNKNALEAPCNPQNFAAFYVQAGCIAVLDEGIWHQGPMCFTEKAPTFVIYTENTGALDKQMLDMQALGLNIAITEI